VLTLQHCIALLHIAGTVFRNARVKLNKTSRKLLLVLPVFPYSYTYR